LDEICRETHRVRFPTCRFGGRSGGFLGCDEAEDPPPDFEGSKIIGDVIFPASTKVAFRHESEISVENILFIHL
jgi:hypothetical protein